MTYNFKLLDREGGKLLETITVFAGSPTEAVKLAKDILPHNCPHEAVLLVDDTSVDEIPS